MDAASAHERALSVCVRVEATLAAGHDTTQLWQALREIAAMTVVPDALCRRLLRCRAIILQRLAVLQQRKLTAFLAPALTAFTALTNLGPLGKDLMLINAYVTVLELDAQTRGDAHVYQRAIAQHQMCLQFVEPLHPQYLEYIRLLCRYAESLNRYMDVPAAAHTQTRALAQAAAMALAMLEHYFDPAAVADMDGVPCYDRYNIRPVAFNTERTFADAFMCVSGPSHTFEGDAATARALEDRRMQLHAATDGAACPARLSADCVFRHGIAVLAAKCLWMLLAKGAGMDAIRSEAQRLVNFVACAQKTVAPIVGPPGVRAAAEEKTELWNFVFAALLLARDTAPDAVTAADVVLDLHDLTLEYLVVHATCGMWQGGDAPRSPRHGTVAPSLRRGMGSSAAFASALDAVTERAKYMLDRSSVGSTVSCDTQDGDGAPVDVEINHEECSAGCKRGRSSHVDAATPVRCRSVAAERGGASPVVSAGDDNGSASSEETSPMTVRSVASTAVDDAASLALILQQHMNIHSPPARSRIPSAHVPSADVQLRHATALRASAPKFTAAARLQMNLVMLLDNDVLALEESLYRLGVLMDRTGKWVDAHDATTTPGPDARTPAQSSGEDSRKRRCWWTGVDSGPAAVGPALSCTPPRQPNTAVLVSSMSPSRVSIGSPGRATAFRVHSPARAAAPHDAGASDTSPAIPTVIVPPTDSMLSPARRAVAALTPARRLFQDEDSGEELSVASAPTPAPASPTRSPKRGGIIRDESRCSTQSRPRSRVHWSPDVMVHEHERRRMRIASFDEISYAPDGVALNLPSLPNLDDCTPSFPSPVVAQPSFLPILPAGPLPASAGTCSKLAGAWPLCVPSSRCVPSQPASHSALSASFQHRVWRLQHSTSAPGSRTPAALMSPVLPPSMSPMLSTSPLLSQYVARCDDRCELTPSVAPPPACVIDDDDARDTMLLALKRAYLAACSELRSITARVQ